MKPLNEEQKHHVEEYREKYIQRFVRWVMKKYNIDHERAIEIIDLAMVKAATHWHEGIELYAHVFNRVRTEAFLDILSQDVFLKTPERLARLKRIYPEYKTYELKEYDLITQDNIKEIDDLDWLNNAIKKLTPAQQQACFGTMHNPTTIRAIKILQNKAKELL